MSRRTWFGLGSSDADVVELTIDPQADDAGVVDAVVPDPGVGVAVAAAGRLCRSRRGGEVR